jgi:hypothetical protein
MGVMNELSGCAACARRTIELVVAIGGPTRVRTGEVCSLDLPGFPNGGACLAFEAKAGRQGTSNNMGREHPAYFAPRRNEDSAVAF